MLQWNICIIFGGTEYRVYSTRIYYYIHLFLRPSQSYTSNPTLCPITVFNHPTQFVLLIQFLLWQQSMSASEIWGWGSEIAKLVKPQSLSSIPAPMHANSWAWRHALEIPAYPYQWAQSLATEPIPKDKVDGSWGLMPEADLWLPLTYTCTHTHAHTQYKKLRFPEIQNNSPKFIVYIKNCRFITWYLNYDYGDFRKPQWQLSFIEFSV